MLKACIPGCEELVKLSDTEITAVATTKIGPVKAQFKGKVQLPISIRPTDTGFPARAKAASQALRKAARPWRSAEKDGGTLLTYNVEAQIGGKLAQLGQRLVNGAAKKIADDFFQKFVAAVRPQAS